MQKNNINRKTNDGLLTVQVSNNMEISPGVFVISFPRQNNFIAGQVIKVAVNRTHPPRIYSICSGINEPQISVLFNIKEDGFLTPKLATMIPGNEILVSEAYGSFICSKNPAWWIGTGTGIAPFYSMFQSGLAENKKLIHGARYLNQFYFEDDLDWGMGNNYIRCCSREQSCDVYKGRVTDYLETIENLPVDVGYYICGKAIMVVETRDLLIQKGVPFEKIFSEIYF
jgi:ferredoxin--NADP+ reductase